MAPSPIILDTSAVIAVLVGEVHRPALIRLTEGAELLSPVSLPVEMGNAFSAMFKRGRISLEGAQTALHAFQRIPIRLTPIDLQQAIELSHRFGIYAYDAYLISCGLQHRAPLLTLDRGLRDTAHKAGVEVLEVAV